MIEFIQGRYAGSFAGGLVIEANGIGYRIYMAQPPVLNVGDELKLYTYLKVREDGLDLFGFQTPEERYIFEMAISVSGVGPKTAVNILSVLRPSDFALAIVRGDVKTLSKVKGFGKKTAELLIVSLKDKLKKEQLEKPLVAAEPEQAEEELAEGSELEVVEALMMLGFVQSEAKKRVKASFDPSKELEENIRKALQGMDRG